MPPAQEGQSAIGIGIGIDICMGMGICIGIIMLPLQHHIIAGVDPPLA
ncbi:Uncharacterised protein [Mycolicibacterium gilvum]|uniref:Uncharacterized protein n=1 Tax=Mycolicibacterium gilvum TaxID=1804 RepID=A0A378SJT4_9MYCO|nr:Uncharacterised protein [Mycolicibacterium gilvum]